MANVWLVKEGSEPTSGGPFKTASLQECVAELNLNQKDHLCGPERTPRFGRNEPDLVRGPRFVVIEVEQNDGNNSDWKPGFYLAQIPVEAVTRR